MIMIMIMIIHDHDNTVFLSCYEPSGNLSKDKGSVKYGHNSMTSKFVKLILRV